MLKEAGTLKGFRLHATDGDIGHVIEFYFDDLQWVFRYLVVETGSWLLGRKVLISPISVSGIHWEEKKVWVDLTMEQVKESPDIDTDKPISRQMESEFSKYYNFPLYWGGVGLWGRGMSPAAAAEIKEMEDDDEKTIDPAEETKKSHLRSSEEVADYIIQAVDGVAGHVKDFIFDEEKWAIRYMVVDISKLGKKNCILISPKWVDRMVWIDAKVMVNAKQKQLADAPPYERHKAISREYEEKLFDYYSMHPYWEEEAEAEQ